MRPVPLVAASLALVLSFTGVVGFRTRADADVRVEIDVERARVAALAPEVDETPAHASTRRALRDLTWAVGDAVADADRLGARHRHSDATRVELEAALAEHAELLNELSLLADRAPPPGSLATWRGERPSRLRGLRVGVDLLCTRAWLAAGDDDAAAARDLARALALGRLADGGSLFGLQLTPVVEGSVVATLDDLHAEGRAPAPRLLAPLREHLEASRSAERLENALVAELVWYLDELASGGMGLFEGTAGPLDAGWPWVARQELAAVRETRAWLEGRSLAVPEEARRAWEVVQAHEPARLRQLDEALARPWWDAPESLGGGGR